MIRYLTLALALLAAAPGYGQTPPYWSPVMPAPPWWNADIDKGSAASLPASLSSSNDFETGSSQKRIDTDDKRTGTQLDKPSEGCVDFTYRRGI
jgi:hypothetical protein